MITVLSLFDYTGIMVQPWLDKGCRCICVDVKHPLGITEKGNLTLLGDSVLGRKTEIFFRTLDTVDIIFAFPPCTHFAVSGAAWFQKKGLKPLIENLQLLDWTLDIIERYKVPYFIENPIGILSTWWRQPDYKFDPCEFAGYCDDPYYQQYTKKTCLWYGYGFIPPIKKPLPPILGSYTNEKLRKASDRSKTPLGFAQAVFKTMYPLLETKKQWKSKS